MKQRHAVIVLFALIIVSGLTSFSSYHATDRLVSEDMDRALALALEEQQSDVISQDTIRTFNSHLQIAELRGKATVAVDTRQKDFRCEAQCSMATVFSISDQRLASVLWIVTVAWGMFCFHRRKRLVPLLAGMTHYGGLAYSEEDNRFYASNGSLVQLTPMQHQLMEMFFHSPSHSLTKTEICDALWPKKPDASETLYTLIRRLKPVVEQHSDLRIEVDRGKAYELKERT
ncbi:MAG: helix-turn-helix domain-containing protein [Prevotella sp.]|nr:helix-turn-helix domain-containing protein [Prevotella sp.]